MESVEKILVSGAEGIGIQIGGSELEKFKRYSQLIKYWNEKINLVSCPDEEELYRLHFLDSLMCSLGFDFKGNCKVIDLGSGAGFPAVPLKICFPDLEVSMVDARKKRCDFLQLVIDDLHLKNSAVIWDRLENIGHSSEHRGVYDCALARALAPLNVLLEYAMPLLQCGGKFVALKGFNIEGEIKLADNALAILGGSLEQVIPYSFPGEKGRHVVVIKKNGVTPEKYPRRAGVPAKRPL
ncbi:MAG TPA: 16S rRNA (guanine(527)-N(7))-methyltransferase RsmG [Syntrophomonadaceae bacterium]|nr:16S rRNA (guanine(527)-N(7))-methyltransferase RsmG [Syntrophomonadaceae bacterium]